MFIFQLLLGNHGKTPINDMPANAGLEIIFDKFSPFWAVWPLTAKVSFFAPVTWSDYYMLLANRTHKQGCSTGLDSLESGGR
jgi:hypothetical protein